MKRSVLVLASLCSFVAGAASAQSVAPAAPTTATVGSTVTDANGVVIGTVLDMDHITMTIGTQKVIVKGDRYAIFNEVEVDTNWEFGVELDYAQPNCKGIAYYDPSKILMVGSIVLDNNSDWTKGTVYYTKSISTVNVKSFKIVGTLSGTAPCQNFSFSTQAGPALKYHYSFKTPFIVK